MYDKNGDFYSTTKIYGYIKYEFIEESYKFWLGLLNSKLFWFFIQETGYVLRGGYFTFKTNYILPFPVPNIIPNNLSAKIENIVEEILLFKESNPKKKHLKKEQDIDKLVYELYQLSNEEIDVIEKSASLY